MFLVIICTLLTTGQRISAQEPPEVAASFEWLIRTTSGRDVSLTCPVVPGPSLIITWFKDDELIIPEQWMRFRTPGSGWTLRISSVEASDSGRYLCRAVNGFGPVDVAVRLLVDSGELGDEEEESVTTEEPNPLTFTDETLEQPQEIDVSARSRLTVDCSVNGDPHPDVIWLKDGNEFNGLSSQRDDSEQMISHHPLRFERISAADAGRYTCLARHLKHELSITFRIGVIPAKVLRGLAHVVPENTTELVGNPTALSCWVPTAIWPTVRWLQVITVDEDTLHPETAVKLGGRQFREVPSNDTQRKEDGTFLRKLIIDSVSEEDAGTYFCLAQNPSGYLLIATQLIVESEESSRWEFTKSVPMPVIVVLPSLILLALAIGFVVWLKRRDVASPATLKMSATSVPLCPAASSSNIQQHRGSFQAVQSASPSLSNRKFAQQQLFSMEPSIHRVDVHRIHQMGPV